MERGRPRPRKASMSNYSYRYRRRLPHIQGDGGPVFVTFKTLGAFTLTPAARSGVLNHCLYEHEKRVDMLTAVIMPTHVHLLFAPLRDDRGDQYPISAIMQAIKSTAARAVNRAMDRVGPVWQEESFDRVVRREEGPGRFFEYIQFNPVMAGLCNTPSEYEWLWINQDA
jgi:putative transposase